MNCAGGIQDCSATLRKRTFAARPPGRACKPGAFVALGTRVIRLARGRLDCWRTTRSYFLGGREGARFQVSRGKPPLLPETTGLQRLVERWCSHLRRCQALPGPTWWGARDWPLPEEWRKRCQWTYPKAKRAALFNDRRASRSVLAQQTVTTGRF